MRQQNELDPYLTSFYPVFSLVSNMTSPNLDHGSTLPEMISFMANIDYVPEGESDMTKVLVVLAFDYKSCQPIF